MNRRDLFKSFIKSDYSASSKDFQQTKNTALGLGSGFAKYTGIWGYDQAKHLLKRAMFGPTHEQIKQAVQDGLDGTLNKLFQATIEPAPPINYNFTDDPATPLGQSWVNSPFNFQIKGLDDSRRISLASWQMGLILGEGVSIKEKMTLFWYNHFVTESIFDSRAIYKNISLYRENALGNFKDFTKKVTVDPAMLRYLNGNLNSKGAPNENYARELLELFTIGKGPIAGPGDYTNYTELDVQEIAKVLTGWIDYTNDTNPTDKITALFIGVNHNTDTKTLSNRFNNAQIPNLGDQEYAKMIDVIFQQSEVARFISRKLYRWFIYYAIDENIEQNIIQPMADLLIQNDYEIQPVIEALLSSEHFFDPEIAGCMIKSPINYTLDVFKMFSLPIPGSGDYVNQYKTWEFIFTVCYILQQGYFVAPSVAGWKPYYQEPSYYQLWINSVTLPIRVRIMDAVTTVGFPINGVTYKVDVIAMAKKSADPSDADTLIKDFAQYLFPKPISTAQQTFLKTVLLPNGLPDYIWYSLWTQYTASPNDPTKIAPVEQLLRGLLYTMCDFSEFQLS